MTQISAHALTVAVQAVRSETIRLKLECEKADEGELAMYQQELLTYSKADIELRKAYETMQRQSDNLPPYSELVDEIE